MANIMGFLGFSDLHLLGGDVTVFIIKTPSQSPSHCLALAEFSVSDFRNPLYAQFSLQRSQAAFLSQHAVIPP